MGVIGGIAGAVQQDITNQGVLRGTAISQSAASSSTRQSNDLSQDIANTNLDLARWAAKGDYENTIAGNQAKVQDARLTQPSTSGQIGGEAFNLIQDKVEFSVRWKTVEPARMRAIGEYWLRYGYAVQMFKNFDQLPADMMVMTKFTYWKLAETYIKSAPMPETFKQTIRGIFEKGVTVWRNPADIGNVDIADNDPVAGVYL
jgi:hypothetical protein